VSTRSPFFGLDARPIVEGFSESARRTGSRPWVGVRESSPAQGMNDVLNHGCWLLDGDLRTKWVRRRLAHSARSNGS
jgi:hypothetical protein